MNIKEAFGKELPLGQLLSCREERALKQQELFDEFRLPMICFTLNIAGPVKRTWLTDKGFAYGYEHITGILLKMGFDVRHRECAQRLSGFEGYFVIDGDPLAIKQATVNIEEACPAHRLFDIDVLRPDGSKVSRSELGLAERRCLVCDNQAAVCGRSRAHGLEVIIERTNQLLRELVYGDFSEEIAQRAVRALLEEVYTTPKPGLVDRDNNGAHLDMDAALFERSALSLRGYFKEICLMGLTAERCEGALASLRDLGKLAEEKMLAVTGGVNTHKGAIFSLGIMCYCVGFVFGQGEKISADSLCSVCKRVCQNVLDDFSCLDKKERLTAGERLYSEQGIYGVRGEAFEGFPSVFQLALPFYQDMLRCGHTMNDAGCMTLLQLMAQIKDTNVLKRGGTDGLTRCMNRARQILSLNLPMSELIGEIRRFDAEMIEMGLSPGGCADLLALTYFAESVI